MRSYEIPYKSKHKRESEIAWQHFQVYRDLGPSRVLRGIEKLSPDGKKRTVPVVFRWSTEYNWLERCKEFDADNRKDAAKIARKKRKKDIEDWVDSRFEINEQYKIFVMLAAADLAKTGNTMRDVNKFRMLTMGDAAAVVSMKDLMGLGDKDAERLADIEDDE